MDNRSIGLAVTILALLTVVAGCKKESSSDIYNLPKGEVFNLSNDLGSQINLNETMGVIAADLIPLQLHSDGLLSGIVPKKILYHEPWFIIMDQINQPIKVFNHNGKFYASFGIKGKGPDEMLSAIDFALRMDKDMLYILDYMASKIIKYNIRSPGERLSSIFLNNGILRQYSTGRGSLAVSDSQNLILAKKRSMTGSAEILVLDTNGILKSVFSLFDRSENTSQSNKDGIFVQTSNDIIYLSNYSDSIWYWKNQTFVPRYRIPLPFSLDDHQDNQRRGMRLEYKYYLECSQFLYVSFFVGEVKYLYIYNKNTNKGKLINTLANGIVSSVVIPVSEFFYVKDTVMYGYLGHMGVLSRYESNLKLIEGNTNVIAPEVLIRKLKKEIPILEEAITLGNGLIVKYILEFGRQQ